MNYEINPKRDQCPICTFYISQWQTANGKTIVINGKLYHKTCVIDHKLRTGKDVEPQGE